MHTKTTMYALAAAVALAALVPASQAPAVQPNYNAYMHGSMPMGGGADADPPPGGSPSTGKPPPAADGASSELGDAIKGAVLDEAVTQVIKRGISEGASQYTPLIGPLLEFSADMSGGDHNSLTVSLSATKCAIKGFWGTLFGWAAGESAAVIIGGAAGGPVGVVVGVLVAGGVTYVCSLTTDKALNEAMEEEQLRQVLQEVEDQLAQQNAACNRSGGSGNRRGTRLGVRPIGRSREGFHVPGTCARWRACPPPRK